jgi:hypothetical protein
MGDGINNVDVEYFYAKLLWRRLLSITEILKKGGLIYIAEDPGFKSYDFLINQFNHNPDKLLKIGVVPLQTDNHRSILLKKIT